MSNATNPTVTVSSRSKDGQRFYEGTLKVPGLKPTKLSKLEDNSTQFRTIQALKSNAKGLAKRLGVPISIDE